MLTDAWYASGVVVLVGLFWNILGPDILQLHVMLTSFGVPQACLKLTRLVMPMRPLLGSQVILSRINQSRLTSISHVSYL